MSRDRYLLGSVVPLTFNVKDADGNLADAAAVTLTVTRPDGTTAILVVDHPAVGDYRADYVPVQTGWHVARLVATGANAGSIEDAFEVTPAYIAHVTAADVTYYIGAGSWTEPQVASALAAERSAQAANCRIDPYTADLREALLRRCARNLAMRGIPLAVLQGDGETGSVVLPRNDPEVRRLEGPYRRLCFGQRTR